MAASKSCNVLVGSNAFMPTSDTSTRIAGQDTCELLSAAGCNSGYTDDRS